MNNKEKYKLVDDVAFDKYEYVIKVTSEIKSSLCEIFEKYSSFDKNNLQVSVKILKNLQYEICVKCKTDNLFIK